MRYRIVLHGDAIALASFGVGFLFQIALHLGLEFQLFHLLCGAPHETDRHRQGQNSTQNSTRRTRRQYSIQQYQVFDESFRKGRKGRKITDFVRITYVQQKRATGPGVTAWAWEQAAAAAAAAVK